MPEGSHRSDLILDVYGDPICPWCFIGKRRLERALALVGGHGVSVRWRAFQLNPSMASEGMDRAQYLAGKFGGADRARQVYDVIRREGDGEGIAFAFSRIQRTPNTLNAHRLLLFARRAGRADALMEALFRAYFMDGRDIGDTAVLAVLAAAAGCDGAAAAAYLTGDDDRAEVQAEDASARLRGISGVPHFIVAERYQLPGAQSPEVIARAIELARAALGAAG